MGLIKLKIIIAFILFSLCSCISIAQENNLTNDTINRFDTRGRKNGFWIEYLTKNFRPVKKSKKASYYRFIRFANGERFDYQIVPKHYIMKTITDHQDTSSNKGDLVLLDGIYKIYEIKKHFQFREGIYRKEKVLIKECVFKMGFLQVLTEYDEGEKLISDFTDRYKQNEFSYLYQEYSESGELKRNEYIVLENLTWKRLKKE